MSDLPGKARPSVKEIRERGATLVKTAKEAAGAVAEATNWGLEATFIEPFKAGADWLIEGVWEGDGWVENVYSLIPLLLALELPVVTGLAIWLSAHESLYASTNTAKAFWGGVAVISAWLFLFNSSLLAGTAKGLKDKIRPQDE